jgi:hypothetical protein
MVRFIHASRFITLAFLLTVVLTLGFSGTTPAQVQVPSGSTSLSRKLENAFRPPQSPGGPAPVNTVSGGTRQGKDEELGRCIQGERSLVALVPASGIGDTVAEYPTVFWHMPPTAAWGLEFVLRDANVTDIYRVQYSLPKSRQGIVTTAGIRSLTLPASANLSPLEIGHEYHWELALICNPQDRSSDILVEGWIRRVEPAQTVALSTQQTSLQERVALYADARLWYETLAALVELRRSSPNDKNLVDAWKTLLTSVGLDVISEEPLN